jgi:hypothetical protein
MKKSYVVLMRTILGLEPVAVYSTFNMADDFTMSASEDDAEQDSKFVIREFFTNCDPDEAEIYQDLEANYYDDDDDDEEDD